MAFTEQLTQALSIPVNNLWPTNGTGTINTITQIPLKNYRRLMAHVMQGLGAGTVTAYFCGCNTTNGTYVALNNTTALNAAGVMVLNLGVSVNTEGTVEVRSDQFAPGNQYAQLTIVVAGTASNVAASVFGGEAHYHPAQQFDVATTTAGSSGLVQRLVAPI
jgi:hypothetical protein